MLNIISVTLLPKYSSSAEYIGMFFENVSLCESFMKNTDLAGAIQADLRCVKADKTVSNAEVSH